MAKQKILFLITKSVWGGAQRYVYDLATNLPKDRFEVAVAMGGTGPLFSRLSDAGIRTIEISGLARDVRIAREYAAFRALVHTLKTEKPDVLHLNSTKAGTLGALAAFIYKCSPHHRPIRVIFTVHGWGFYEARPWIANVAIFLASWCASLLQDYVITICTRDRDTAHTFISHKKVVYIPNGIREPNLLARHDARTILARQMGSPIDQDTLVVGTIAELTRNKNIIALIKAAALMRERGMQLVFVVVGSGEDHAFLTREIAMHGLTNSFHLAGFIPDAERLLAGFDIFTLPSVKEGLPYALMDAMAAGLPCVATSVGGIPDLITDGVNGIIIPSQSEIALAQALKTLIKNNGLRQQYGLQARTTIQQKFQRNAMISRTTALYEYEAS